MSKVAEIKPINESGIYPVDMRVVIKPEVFEEKTEGGILILEAQKKREEMGHIKAVITAIGAQAFEDIKNPSARPKEGAVVSIAKYSGYLIKGKDGEEYRIINDTDVVAVLDGSWDIRSDV